MNQFQRYVFVRLFTAFGFAFPALTVTIWLTQALGRIDLVTDRGQGLDVFLQATILFLPGLVTVIGPVSVLIAVLVTLNGLHSDSELVSASAGGAAPGLLIRPVLMLAIPVAIVSAASTLYFGPISVRASNLLIANVNASVISALIQPGQFRALGEDVTVHVRARRADGTLEDIFVFDQRETGQDATYIASDGAVVETDEGRFLLMQNGVVQRRDGTGNIVTIAFDSHAFDLSTLATRASIPGLRPNERPTAYLFDPSPNDPVFQANPYRYVAELHNRLTTPLYVLVLALVPAAFLGTARTVRRGRAVATTAAAIIAGAAMAGGLFLAGAIQTNAALAPVVWGLPLAGIVLPVAVLLSGRRVRLLPHAVTRVFATMMPRRRRTA